MKLERLALLSLAASTLLCGCATRPAQQADFPGTSVRLTMAQQVIDPAAGLKPVPAGAIDGQAAKSAYDAYQKSYRAPLPQTNALTIGIGGGR